MPKKWILFLVTAALLIGIGIAVLPQITKKQENEKEIITESTLEKIIRVSELSTFTAVYNGITEVKNRENPDTTDYYVSYEAKVKAGIDFEKIKITVDNEEKIIRIAIPDAYITKATVDIGSLDYIFMNNKANTSSVSQEAFKACEADVQAEIEKEDAILKLAAQNARNIITALVHPIMEQLDAKYQLIIE